MSTAISQTELSTVLPKSIPRLNPGDEKPHLNRSSSIDTIKKINTYICSPQSYLLPAILTTWLKSGQNSLQASTEKTIFMFRYFIFGSTLVKFLLNDKSGDLGGQAAKLDLQTVLVQIIANLHAQFLKVLNSAFVVSLIFKLAVVFLTAQVSLCAFYISQSIVPIGLGFLLLCLGYTGSLGYSMNKFYLIKRDVKSKRQ